MTLKEATEKYIFHCIYEKNLSKKTIEFYTIDINQFSALVIANDSSLKIEQIDKEVIKLYFKSLFVFKPKTIKRKLASIKAMFNFLEFEDFIASNPFRKVRVKIKEPKSLPVVMSLNEVKCIFQVVYKDLYKEKCVQSYRYLEKLRNVVIIELLFSTGVRVSELCNLKNEDVNLSEGYIKVNGKGNKERIINIGGNETLKIIKQYAECNKDPINFFTSRVKAKLTEQSVRNLIKQTKVMANLNKNITPHTFRHSMATLLLERGVDIKFIQNILGHSSIMTTQIYTHVNNAKQKEILGSMHPRITFTCNKGEGVV